MFSEKIRFYLTFLSALLLALTSWAQTSDESSPTLNQHLGLLAPLTNKTWVGQIKALDEDRYLKVERRFDIIWGGNAVKLTSSCKELNNENEGFFYWDFDEQKIALFKINNRGVVQTGLVTEDQGKLLLSGTIVFPDKKLQYRNTFELTSEGKLIDRWYRLENGEWLPGHDVELEAEE